MPNNIEGRGLTDREMVQLCLELEKGRCRGISNTMIETSHKELRDIYESMLENANNNQYELYEMLEEKGWYKTELASADQIKQVQGYMQNNLHPDNQF
ncbi:spore coat protein [Metabacillus litoralis]|uniref:Spore coat protein n=1 Tax=Metabacillus litoralis TaxID=152268 RepID=A0A5C6W6K4_9BACI|nr:spore coat protein [Metabacillus litoralis]TXC92963.1 spore coat protein [Metabacillus litoralis]